MTKPEVLSGTDIANEDETVSRIKTSLQDEGQYYASFPYQCTEYRLHDEPSEKINLLTINSWFANITDKLKFKCFKELATVRFSPSLNLRSSEEAAKDTEKLKKAKKGKEADIKSYYVNMAEELNDFDEWCISERGVWGIPIPHFVR